MNTKTRQSGLEEQLRKKPNRKGRKGVDNFANACQSVCSTRSPSTEVSFVHTAPVKTASLHNGHMSNSSLTAAAERHSVHLSGTEQTPAAVTTESTSAATFSDTSITRVTMRGDICI